MKSAWKIQTLLSVLLNPDTLFKFKSRLLLMIEHERLTELITNVTYQA
jgi:hypothetical protein